MNAFFINTKIDEIYEVPRTHIDYIYDNPDEFNITRDYIDSKYAEYKEKPRFEGKARNNIIERLIKKGWVRIRYNSKSNTWHINYDDELHYVILYCMKWFEKYFTDNNTSSFKFIHINGETQELNITECRKIILSMETNNCRNCKSSTWAVGVGQGFFCTNEVKLKVEKDNLKISSTGFTRFMIPRKDYTCRYFEPKKV